MVDVTDLSPLIAREAKRLQIGRFARPEASFSRQHTGELIPTAPISPAWKDWLAGALMFIFVAIVLLFTLAGCAPAGKTTCDPISALPWLVCQKDK